MKELTHDIIGGHSPFVVVEVICNPRTLYLGLKMENEQGDSLHLELNNYWALFSAETYYSWSDNSRGIEIPVDLQGERLISHYGYNNFYGNFFIFSGGVTIFSLTPDNDYPESTWGITYAPSEKDLYFSGELTPELQRDYLKIADDCTYSLFPHFSSAGVEFITFPNNKISDMKIGESDIDFEKIYFLRLNLMETNGGELQILIDNTWEYRSSSLVVGSSEGGKIFEILSNVLLSLKVEKQIVLKNRGKIIVFDDGSGIIQTD